LSGLAPTPWADWIASGRLACSNPAVAWRVAALPAELAGHPAWRRPCGPVAFAAPVVVAVARVARPWVLAAARWRVCRPSFATCRRLVSGHRALDRVGCATGERGRRRLVSFPVLLVRRRAVAWLHPESAAVSCEVRPCFDSCRWRVRPVS